MRTCWCLLLVSTGAATWDTAAKAGEVINWGGGGYVTNSQPMNGSLGSSWNTYSDPDGSYDYNNPMNVAIPNWTIRGREVSDTTEYNPQTGYSGRDAQFFGGHAVVMKDGPNDGARRMGVLQGSGTPIHADVQSDIDLQKFAMLTYWKLDDSKTYIIDGTSNFTLSSTQDSQDKNPNSHTLRWVIRDGSQFYLSKQDPPTANANGGLNFTNNGTYSSMMSALSWVKYNPYTNYNTQDGRGLESIFASHSLGSAFTGTFTNINAVGFYIDYLRQTTNGASGIDYKITSFKVDLDPTSNAVPEPGTFLLGLVGFGGAAARCWRQRRKVAAAKSDTAAVVS